MNKAEQSKSVVILFPWSKLGGEIANTFLNNNYPVILIMPEREAAKSFKQQMDKYQNNLKIYHINSTIKQFWSDLSTQARENILSAPIIVHFAGSDYLQMKSQTVDERWRVKEPDQVKKRFDFIDSLLAEIENQSEKLWFNLVVGKGAQKDQGIIYCHTRYGMTGFSKVIELNPKFSNFEIVNICLTYFKHHKKQQKIHHCSYCLTEKLNDLLLMLEEEGTLGDYMLVKSERYLKPHLLKPQRS